MSAKAPGVLRHGLPAASHDGYLDIRVAPLLAMPALLREHGVDPALVLAQVGLDPRLFDDPENRVSAGAIGRLLDTSVKLTGCPHFGLLVGQRFKLDSLGVLGTLMRNCPTLRDALRLAALHLELHDRSAVSLTLNLGDGTSALGYSLLEDRTPAAEQFLDGAIAMQYLLLRELCGPAWKPVSIRLSHSRPANVAPLRKHFRARLEFDAPVSGIVFASRWLDHPIAGADPAAFAAITSAIESAESRHPMPFSTQVRRALYAMMFAGPVSTAGVARLFAMHERTLRRRLAEEGATVRGVLGEARREVAHHLLRDTDMPVSEIAAVLRYSDVTVFARAFRRWSKMSPRQWRAEQASARHRA